MTRRGLGRWALALLAGAATAACCTVPAAATTVPTGAVDARPDAHVPLPGTALDVYLSGDSGLHRVSWRQISAGVLEVVDVGPGGDTRVVRVVDRGEQPGTQLAGTTDRRGVLGVFKAATR